MATRRDEGRACRSKVWGWADDLAGAHAGLLLDRALRTPVKRDKHPDERARMHTSAIRSLKVSHALYEAAFGRRLEWVKALKAHCAVADFNVETPSHQRLVIGLGRSSPLETGLMLHHTYGVPIVPGSALKGIASTSLPPESNERKVLFGATDDAGFIACHDAWMLPESITSTQQGLLQDVMTPHHGDYYEGRTYTAGPRSGEIMPPTDFDDPNPVTFLSVRGTFHVVLSCEDRSVDGETWLGHAKSILLSALKDGGVGGKGSSGYGRLVEVRSV